MEVKKCFFCKTTHDVTSVGKKYICGDCAEAITDKGRGNANYNRYLAE